MRVEEEHITYVIEDIRSDLGYFWVGISKSHRMLDRMLNHLTGEEVRTRDRINELFSILVFPVWHQLEVSRNITLARQSERTHIRRFLAEGHQLLNRNYALEPGAHRGEGRGRKLTRDAVRLHIVHRLLTGRYSDELSQNQRLYFDAKYVNIDAPKRNLALFWLRETNGEA